jgi:protein gp37
VGSIEWTDRTWDPTRGCSRASEGCHNCYAERVAHRFSGVGKPYEGLVDTKGRWTGEVRLVPERLAEPLRWRKPSMVFVDSMSDLFHPEIPDEYIAAVYAVMAASPRHTFQVLTKRPDRALAWFEWLEGTARRYEPVFSARDHGWRRGHALHAAAVWRGVEGTRATDADHWPLPNVWIGVSVEDQATADERIPLLLQCPAAVRFVSYEPALGPVNLTQIDYPGLNLAPTFRFDALRGGGRQTETPWRVDWVSVGGESGAGARPCNVEWIRAVVRQCESAGVACYVKQLGAMPVLHTGLELRLRDRKGGDPAEWPEDLRVREWPDARQGVEVRK